MKIREEFAKATTAEEVKAIYKKLAMKYHPDRGGDVEIMKAVNSLYDEYFERLKHVHKTKDGKRYEKETNETSSMFKDIIDKLLRMNGVEIEIIGCFIWVSGNTKPHKEEIKALGFRWHSKKKVWYKAPDGYRKKSRKTYSMDDIRGMYGTSGKMYGEGAEELTA